MKTTRLFSIAFAVAGGIAVSFAQTEPLTPAQLNARAKAQNVPEIPFETVPNFLKLPPNLYLGEGIGVATNSKGHIFVYTRSQTTRLFEFDQRGNFVREIGEGLYGFAFAHAVRVDSQDNIWAVDEGTNMVIKFNPEGRVAMVLGHRPEAVPGPPPAVPASNAPYEFDRPTDVAFDAQGNIFVSDGYGNSRVAKYDKNGRFLKSVGSRGSAPGQLNLPHTSRLTPRATSTWGIAATAASRCSTTIWSSRPSTIKWARPGRCASRPARTSISTARIPTPTTTTRRSSR